MKRIIFALLFVSLLVLAASFIPDNSSVAYPPPVPTPTAFPPLYPGATPQLNFRVGNVSCTQGFLTWYSIPAHINTDDIRIHGVTYDREFLYPVDYYYTLDETDYFRQTFDESFMEDRIWAIEGLVLVEGSVPVYSTWNHVELDCTGLMKHRIRFPVIFKQWR